MFSSHSRMLGWILAIVLVAAGQQSATAQGGGGYAPSAGGYHSSSGKPAAWRAPGGLSNDAALNYIAIDGVAERRLMPDQIRVVLAVSTESETIVECRKKNAAQIAAVLKNWSDLGVAREKIVTDFIAITPQYAWRNATRDQEQVREQYRAGYRMLTNLHIAVANEEAAMDAIEAAFQGGVTEIVTFDYGSSQLNDAKDEVRQAALAAAQKKAALLLAVFAERPAVINIEEKSVVYLPQQLYATYENVQEEQLETSYAGRDKPRIKAYRPKMTFYHGLKVEADDRPTTIALRPEIVVVSTVRIYYQSPAQPSRTSAQAPALPSAP